ncbi:unnamed protein product [Cuscuta epithymum]|uniref:Transmembrane protein n=1 Tax=Cuscuta epithymum TaxID=186058 RepID=A0AAV0GFN2_9ASTE|nr:unnamed protein product [Cuscuta epithymum]
MSQPQVNPINTYITPPSSVSSSNSDSNGSFGPVFVVLAVVVVLSAIACVFGRVCNGGKSPKGAKKESKKGKKGEERKANNPISHTLDHKEWGQPRKFQNEEDIEIGFDVKRKPKPSSNKVHEDPRGPKPYQHGPQRGQGFSKGPVRFANNV